MKRRILVVIVLCLCSSPLLANATGWLLTPPYPRQFVQSPQLWISGVPPGVGTDSAATGEVSAAASVAGASVIDSTSTGEVSAASAAAP